MVWALIDIKMVSSSLFPSFERFKLDRAWHFRLVRAFGCFALVETRQLCFWSRESSKWKPALRSCYHGQRSLRSERCNVQPALSLPQWRRHVESQDHTCCLLGCEKCCHLRAFRLQTSSFRLQRRILDRLCHRSQLCRVLPCSSSRWLS